MKNVELEHVSAQWVEAGLIDAAQREAILVFDGEGPHAPDRPWVTTFGEALAYLGGFSLVGGFCWWVSAWAMELSAGVQLGILTGMTLVLFGMGSVLIGRDKGVFQRLGGMLWTISLYTGCLALIRVALSFAEWRDGAHLEGTFLTEELVVGAAAMLAGVAGLGLAYRGIRDDLSLARHITTAMVLSGTAFIAGGSVAFEEPLIPALLAFPILWTHVRSSGHGAATAVLSLTVVAYVPMALGETLDAWEIEEAVILWSGLLASVAWLAAVQRWDIGPRRWSWTLTSVVLALWLVGYGTLYEADGVATGVVGAIALLTTAVRRQDAALFGAGAFSAMVMGPRAATFVLGEELSGALGLMMSGGALVVCGVGLIVLWTRYLGAKG